MKNVEVIGEAANMLTRHFRETHIELPWRLIVSMRNVLVHGYAQVSDADLWQTASCDIQPLRELPCGQQQLDEQLVQFLSRVEILASPRLPF